MCGIHAIISGKPNIAQSISQMVGVTYHRGPDAQQTYVNQEQGVALGHNRLAILDLSHHGVQPMHNRQGDLSIVHNGEIYNYQALRKTLREMGYEFTSNTDTEVILHGYDAWGVEVFSKLNGMWGTVIYDQKRRKIVVSRDRVGIKPVYYYHQNGELVVASEIKAILRSDYVRAAVSMEGLNEYFSFQNVISHHTLFKDIYMLKAGHIMEYALDDASLSVSQYWDMEYPDQSDINVDDFCAETLRTFRNALDGTLISDVPIGASISGGMDSSSIIALASQDQPNINSFTGYFDHSNLDANERSINESDDARIVANHFGTNHHERIIHSTNVIDTLPAIVWHLEDPKVGMCYTFYHLNQLISQHVTVNLSGTGGDETFGGYPWRYDLIKDANDYDTFCHRYYDYWCRLVSDEQKSQFFTSAVYQQMDEKGPWKAFREISDVQRDATPITRAIYFEFKTFLHGMLMVEDKMGMAYSVETRFPFLDNDMLALTARIPDHFKYDKNEAKLLLKKAFEHLLPPEIIQKRKQGFTPPDMSWYRKDLASYIQQLLLGPRSMIGEYVNRDYIQATLTRHNQGEDQRLLIWSLMFFEGWLRTFIAGDGSQIRQF